jgi:hypothetical protein
MEYTDETYSFVFPSLEYSHDIHTVPSTSSFWVRLKVMGLWSDFNRLSEH